MMTPVKRLLATEAGMPLHAQAALARFTEVNPNWAGADWADCLDVLLDSDSHLDITEPLWEVLADTMDEDARSYIGDVAVTLTWSGVQWPQPAEVRHWCVLLDRYGREIIR